ncbi:MAG: CHAT domain-containing protein [Thiotrichaceae bacterium]|nr:CHAT domain-containing protein [Thiotrichaceae bacterium]
MACFCISGFSTGLYAQESSVESVSAQTITAYVSRAALAKQQGQWLRAAQALANAARLTLKNGQWDEAKELAYQALAIPHNGQTPHESAYLLINLGRTLAQIDQQLNDPSHRLRLQAFHLFNKATKMATRANDIKTLSYALGYTAALFETEQRYPEALAFTRRAIFHAQQANATQSMLLWQWQRGRLLAASGQRSAAVAAYRQAIKRLPRFSLSSMAEISTGQLYLQLVDLLLKEAQQSRDTIKTTTLLRAARDLVEQMKAAELRDYFQDECVDKLQAKVKDVSKISATALVIYPIILEDRLELLLDFPNGEMKRYSVPVGNHTLSAEIHRFRRLLEKRTTNQYRPHGKQLYEWLITPFESELASLNIDTLVFVPDGALRTIPLAALYDGEQFLIEKYAVATTPGVELTDPAPLDRHQIKPLYVGLSQSVQGFPALESVPEELKGINDLYHGKLLLDEDFTKIQFRNALADRQLNVLHIATHGKFSGDADSSFILTYDGRLSMNQLAKQIGMFKFRERPLELLVLSACETAQGDERAALGLSGMAIKAGARSVVGTLWKVDDIAASQLIRDFYRQLQDPQASRAVALQRAQRAMLNDIRFRHPGYWSAYLLINGWL